MIPPVPGFFANHQRAAFAPARFLFGAVALFLSTSAVTTPVSAVTISVPSQPSIAVETPVLEAGKTYIFEARGTYGYGHDDWADAEFLSYFGSDPIEFHAGFSVDVLDLTIDGQAVDWLGGPDWLPHTFSPDHVYRYNVVGDGTTVSLALADWWPLIDNDLTWDNSGSVEVTITAVPDSGVTVGMLAGTMLLLGTLQRLRRR